MCAYRRKGFSLIELLIVIGVISLLIAIIVPVSSKVYERAQRTKVASNLRQIALAYLLVNQDNPQIMKRLNTAQEWAAQLAFHAGLNDASMYYIPSDDLLSDYDLAKSILLNNNDIKSLNPEFINAPISFTFVTNIPSQASVATTPIGWTRGLNSEGYWDKNSPYKGKGGYIVFLDGHVAWYTNITKEDNPLYKYTSGEKTTNVLEAISSISRVLPGA